MNLLFFFKKNLKKIIIISLFFIVIIIGIYHNINRSKTPLSSLESESEKEVLSSEEFQKKKHSAEIIPPQIQTNSVKLEKIKTYLFTDTDNLSLLPDDLSVREKEEIFEMKKSWKFYFDLLNKKKIYINEYQKECDEYQSQIISIQSKIQSLKPQLLTLEQQRDEKEHNIKNLQYQLGEISPVYAKVFQQKYNIKINNSKTPDKIEETNLKEEINMLQNEVQKIVSQIKQIKFDIADLESKQKKYQNMLFSAEKSKKSLEQRYKDSESKYKQPIIFQLNSLFMNSISLQEKNK
ncbi:MAG: hypothetical protein Q8844_01120 [Pigeon pea little leaf phytoplasma]|nr:hypothetical protein [Pigeon pea little leaf phytoplasma]MDV3188968.1 hypothetical protein [Pigeon pea little leaf phytoplasma]